MGKNRVRLKQLGPKGGSAAALNPMADFAIPPEEMIHLPPKMDSKTTRVWPMMEVLTMKYDQFTVIYPTYLDSTKTAKLGRRISRSDAVPNPAVEDISAVLQTCNIRHAIQPYKGYPRDVESRWYNPGRVLVDINNDVALKLGLGLEGNSNNSVGDDEDDIPILDMGGDTMTVTKKQLCREIAKRIPKMPSRIRRLVEEKKKEEEEKKKASQQKKNKSGGGGGGGSGSSHRKTNTKKKGKKKR